MKILAVASNDVLVAEKIIGRLPYGLLETRGTKVVPLEKFLTAGQNARIARNQKFEQTVYAELRKRLESKVIK